jgi:hypothetical protein
MHSHSLVIEYCLTTYNVHILICDVNNYFGVCPSIFGLEAHGLI